MDFVSFYGGGRNQFFLFCLPDGVIKYYLNLEKIFVKTPNHMNKKCIYNFKIYLFTHNIKPGPEVVSWKSVKQLKLG